MLSLVAVSAADTRPVDRVLGLIDVEIDDMAATIDVVAVHPDHHRRGIAASLLQAVLPRLRERSVRTLDAWTREDAASNAWYRAHGLVERDRYLHVYKQGDEPADGFETPVGLSEPVTAFMHARIEEEEQLRRRHRRVYVCRRYVLDLEVRG